MSKYKIYWIGGAPGSGKSTINKILKGFDIDWIGLHVGIKDGNFVYGEAARSLGKWHWVVTPNTVVTLSKYYGKKIFCGLCNTLKEISEAESLNIVWIWLEIPDNSILEERIKNRKDNDFGKRPGELERALSANNTEWTGVTWHMVDATGSIEETVKNVRKAMSQH